MFLSSPDHFFFLQRYFGLGELFPRESGWYHSFSTFVVLYYHMYNKAVLDTNTAVVVVRYLYCCAYIYIYISSSE